MQFVVATEDKFNLRIGDVAVILPDSHQFGGKDLEGCRVVTGEEDLTMLENLITPNHAFTNSNTIQVIETHRRIFYYDINNTKKRRAEWL